MATRDPRPTRFSRESKAKTVDIDQAHAEVGRRIEIGTEQGKPFLRVVVPTPREPKPEQVIDLSFLYALPNLADALAEAFLDWTATTQRTASRGGEAAHLRVGLVAFLVDTGRTATTPEGLTTELANAFIGWLNEKQTGRDEPLQENSRAKLFGTLRRLIKHLRQLPKWSGRILRELYIRDSPWPMRHLKRKATEILPSDDLQRLLSACAEEVPVRLTESNRAGGCARRRGILCLLLTRGIWLMPIWVSALPRSRLSSVARFSEWTS